ncbi:MAG: hypothetical protein ACOYL8_00435 [Patescibacteria group bacterium]
MKRKSLYLVLVPLLLWFLNELFFVEPAFFFASLGIAILILSLSIKAIIKDTSPKFWLVFVLSPALFYLSFSFYSAIIVSQFWIQAIFILNALFIYYYLKNIYYYFSFGAPERELKLKKLLLSGSFLATFALSATLYGLPIFLNWPSLSLLLVFCLLSFFIFSQFLVFSKQIDNNQKIYLGINVLILTQFAGALFLLPLNYNILGLLVAIVFYLLVLFNSWQTEDRLNFKNLRWPLGIAASIITLILLTARWL